MQIAAKCKWNLEVIKSLVHLLMFGKKNPKTSMLSFSILFFLFACVILALKTDFLSYIVVVSMIVLIISGFFIYFISPKIRYNALGKLKDAEIEYIFCDDSIKVFTRSKEYNDEAECKYSIFVKAYETSRYFFFFATNNQVYIIDKATIVDGCATDVRNKIKPILNSKYFICKY